MYIPKPKDIVRVWKNTGVVLDVFTSPTSGEYVAQILLVKNIFRGQSFETHTSTVLESGGIRPATLDELRQEIEDNRGALERRTQNLLHAADPSAVVEELEAA